MTMHIVKYPNEWLGHAHARLANVKIHKGSNDKHVSPETNE